MSTKKRRKGSNIVIVDSIEDLFYTGDKVLEPSNICRAYERKEFIKKMDKVLGCGTLLFEVIYCWIYDLMWWIAERQENQKDTKSL